MITGYYQQFLRRTLYIYTKKLYSAVGLLSGVSVRFLRDDALCPAGLHLSTRGGHLKLSRYGSIEFDPSHIASGHPLSTPEHICEPCIADAQRQITRMVCSWQMLHYQQFDILFCVLQPSSIGGLATPRT